MTVLRSTLEQNIGWIVLSLLLIGCLLVLSPFVTALLWGTILSYSSWPLYYRLLKLLRDRRTLAALLLSFAMILVVLLPFAVVGLSLADNVSELTTAIQRWIDEGPPGPPEWLKKVPLIGLSAAERWQI